MSQNKLNAVIAAILIVFILISSSAYIINERQIAVITQFSRLINTDAQAGLKFKIPFIQHVEFFDARIQSINAEPERFLTSEKKSLIVDYFVEWRIKNIRTFYTSVQGNFQQAGTLLDNMVKESLRGEFVQRTVKEAISEERGAIMADATKRLSAKAQERYGIEVLGVRLKRVDFSDENRDQVFARMRAERERVSKDFRARGREKADIIRATADREAAELLANARQKADIMRGKADAQAAEQYAASYGQDLEFYRYWQSMNAYRDSLSGSTLIITPDSQFFRYFNHDNLPVPADAASLPKEKATSAVKVVPDIPLQP